MHTDRSSRWPRSALATAASLFLLPGATWADAAPQAPTPTPPPTQLQPVIVTGNPLRSEQLGTPASVLAGDELARRRGSSLGETLDGLPGLSSTYFGPNANRPVIRGQDGDRIRVLANGGASLDASSLSFDHAVPLDPLVVERIEVLRGPAALLYGGSAVGGVVNAIDNRIPRSPTNGPSGVLEARLGGAANERGLSALVETGGAGWALHADAFSRRTDDLRVPAFDRPVEEGGSERRTRVVNSASQARGGAVGVSWVGAKGYLGVSADTYRNRYGTVAEEDITIRMHRDKLALAGEWRAAGGPAAGFSTVRAQAAWTDYQHQEIEGDGTVGTTFKTHGSDWRLEAVHARHVLGGGVLEGVLGAQGEASHFEALGDEAFVPSTRTRQAALFLHEQWRAGKTVQISGGLRAERVTVQSDGDADALAAKFGPATERRFSARSASLGAVFTPEPAWQLSASVSSTERAPTSYELYANGVHAATATFERGSTAQNLERGRHLELAAQWQTGSTQLRAGVFASRFANYIALQRTGEPDYEDEEGNAFPILAFKGTPARLHGLELSATQRLLPGLSATAQLDWVRGSDRRSGEPLPRLAPLRSALALEWQREAWQLRAEWVHAWRQDRVPNDDGPTPGWNLLNLTASLQWGGALLFVRAQNLGNTLAYNASSIATVRPLTPLPGRSVQAGMRWAF